MNNRLKIAMLATAAALMVNIPAFAADEYNTSTGVTTAGVPLGLHGFDPVALISYNAVAEGEAEFTVVHDDVAYYFASKQSADTFSADPYSILVVTSGWGMVPLGGQKLLKTLKNASFSR